MSPPSEPPLRVLTVALCAAALAVLAPLWAPLVLAAWCADLLQPFARRLQRLLGGRRRAAATIVVLLTVGTLLVLAAAGAALAASVREVLDQARAALEGQGSLTATLLGANARVAPPMREWAELAGRYGAGAWAALGALARGSARVVVDVLVFVAALYAFVVDGERLGAWLLQQAPISRDVFERLGKAFHETGRGLIVGGGGTALVQGALATLVYAAIGIRGALLLGPLTAVCTLVPVVGTGLVWVPLAVQLLASGQYQRASVVVVLGAGVHSLVDNFVRPVLTRRGRLALPALVVLLSMLGGIALVGPTGVALGPLVVRLGVEVLAIRSERAGRGS